MDPAGDLKKRLFLLINKRFPIILYIAADQDRSFDLLLQHFFDRFFAIFIKLIRTEMAVGVDPHSYLPRQKFLNI